MKVTITCTNGEVANRVYDLLVEHNQGHGCLQGSKTCTDECIMVPDIMVFDLTLEEINAVKKIPGVLSVSRNLDNLTLFYEKVGQEGYPRLASFKKATWSNTDTTLSGKQIPHSLLFGQTYQSFYTNSPQTSGSILASLSSINCSNVDIVVFDSGVDATHPDFLNSNGISNVIPFDWTLLKEGDPLEGSQIVATQSSNYYKDYQGHGTAVASLVAGNRCGFAKNAKIYSLRIQGLDSTAFYTQAFTVTQGLKLMLAFQKAKNKNLFGLDKTRPTVMVNSWGYTGPYTDYDLMLETTVAQNDLNLIYSIDKGSIGEFYRDSGYPTSRMLGNDTYSDGYFRQFLTEGIHVVKSAGNENTFMVNDPSLKINMHIFELLESGVPSGIYFSKIVTQENINSYLIGFIYLSYTALSEFLYIGTDAREFTSSPNIGTDRDKSAYPIIIVGDVIPIGYGDVRNDIYFSAGNAESALQLLSSTTSNSIIVNQNTLYNSKSGSFFVKSSYSNFGPDVDIYAPGNGTWAAHSNQVSFTTSYPIISTTSNNAFRFFNGTSASCPIVAGMLATFLSEFPSTPPLSARAWLLNAAISGNIMETQSNFLPVSTYYDDGFTRTYNMAFGSSVNDFNILPPIRMDRYGGSFEQYYKTGNLYDLLFCNRFFNSNNLLAQAYPIRKTLIKSNEPFVKIGNTTLKRKWDYNSKTKAVQKTSLNSQQQPITKNIPIPNTGRVHVLGNNSNFVLQQQAGAFEVPGTSNPSVTFVTFAAPTCCFAEDISTNYYNNGFLLSGNNVYGIGRTRMNNFYFGASQNSNLLFPRFTYATSNFSKTFVALSAEQKIDKIVGGYGNNFYLSSGRVFCLGTNQRGKLGIGSSVAALNSVYEISGRYTDVFTGAGQTFFLSGDKGFCCGDNKFGQLGIGMPLDTFTETLQPISGSWKKFASGYTQSFALSTPSLSGGSTVFVTGSGSTTGLGSISNFTNTFTPLPGLWSDVVAGFDTSFLRDFRTGIWYVCGRNNYGQLGVGLTGADVTTFQSLPLTATYDEICPGIGFTCALKNNKLYSTGGRANPDQIKSDSTPLNPGLTGVAYFQPISGNWLKVNPNKFFNEGDRFSLNSLYFTYMIEKPEYPECIVINPVLPNPSDPQITETINCVITDLRVLRISNTNTGALTAFQITPTYEGKDSTGGFYRVVFNNEGSGFNYKIKKYYNGQFGSLGTRYAAQNSDIIPGVFLKASSPVGAYVENLTDTNITARISAVDCFY